MRKAPGNGGGSSGGSGGFDGAIEAVYGSHIAQLLHRDTLFEMVPLIQMFRDPEYARPVDARRVNKIANAWNPLRLLVLVLSLRPDGRFAIIDGAHRHAAAASRGQPLMLPSQVFIDLTVEQEAELFRALNEDRSPATPMDIFRAAWCSGQPQALAIRSTCNTAGFDVAVDGQGANRITGISALQTMYAKTGTRGLLDILSILAEAWGTDGRIKRVTHAYVLLGLMHFWIRYVDTPKFSRPHLIARLKASEPEIVLGRSEKHRTVKSGVTPPLAVGKVLLENYNTSLHHTSKLPEWQDHVTAPAYLSNSPDALRQRRAKAARRTTGR